MVVAVVAVVVAVVAVVEVASFKLLMVFTVVVTAFVGHFTSGMLLY